jgi:hypothetical protein
VIELEQDTCISHVHGRSVSWDECALSLLTLKDKWGTIQRCEELIKG